jgi:FkbM family methyltransferase
MDINYFLYRRLARWITCRVRLPFNRSISLASKHDVASFQDVFCHPFYWQAYGWLREPPKYVVDCGANCGHFSVLMDTCIKVRFGSSDTQYVLVEPNPGIIPVLRRNLRDAGLLDRSRIITGLLGGSGSSGESGTLWVHRKNFLASSATPTRGAVPHKVSFVDLQSELVVPRIDVLKVDIEGAEYGFIRNNPALLNRIGLLLMEVHEAPAGEQSQLFRRIEASGLEPLEGSIMADGLWLRAWRRPGNAAADWSTESPPRNAA